MPAYLLRFDMARPLRENLLRDVLRPEGFLFDEVQFLLRSALSNPATSSRTSRSSTPAGERVCSSSSSSPTSRPDRPLEVERVPEDELV